MGKQLLMNETGLQIGSSICGVTIEEDGDLAFENDERFFRFSFKISKPKTRENVIAVIQDFWSEPERCLGEIERLCPSANLDERQRKLIIHLFNCFGETVSHLQMKKDLNRF